MTDSQNKPGISLIDVLNEFFARSMDEVRTAFVGVVQSYNSATQTATIKPPVLQPVPTDSDGREYEQLPVLPAVPVAFPRAGNAFIHVPIASGHKVLVICCENSFHHWRAGNGDNTQPGDERRHHLANAVAIPLGIYLENEALSDVPAVADKVAIGYQGGTKITVDSSFVRLGQNATKAIGLNSDNCNVTAPWLTWFTTVGTGAPAGPPPPGPIATLSASSTKAKAE